jgi:hypothetical protein
VIARCHGGCECLFCLSHFLGERCAIGGIRSGESGESDEAGQRSLDTHAQCS